MTAMPHLAEDGENPGIERREVIEIVAIDALDPMPVVCRSPRISHADSHFSPTSKQTARPGLSRLTGPPLRPCGPEQYLFAVLLLLISRRRRLTRRRARRISRRRSSGSTVGGSSSVLGLSGSVLSSISRAVGRIGRSGSRVRSSAGSRSGLGRCGRGFSARGFLLRAGCEHQRRDKSAKSKFGVHRSIPREKQEWRGAQHKISSLRFARAYRRRRIL